MSRVHPNRETRLAPPFATYPPTQSTLRPSQPSLGIDHQHLRAIIAGRRATLSAIETEMVTYCEADAARAAPRSVRLDDRGTWDRAMWDRYLSAATRLEPDYMPRMLRLHRELGRLERLLLLPALTDQRAA